MMKTLAWRYFLGVPSWEVIRDPGIPWMYWSTPTSLPNPFFSLLWTYVLYPFAFRPLLSGSILGYIFCVDLHLSAYQSIIGAFSAFQTSLLTQRDKEITPITRSISSSLIFHLIVSAEL